MEPNQETPRFDVAKVAPIAIEIFRVLEKNSIPDGFAAIAMVCAAWSTKTGCPTTELMARLSAFTVDLAADMPRVVK